MSKKSCNAMVRFGLSQFFTLSILRNWLGKTFEERNALMQESNARLSLDKAPQHLWVVREESPPKLDLFYNGATYKLGHSRPTALLYVRETPWPITYPPLTLTLPQAILAVKLTLEEEFTKPLITYSKDLANKVPPKVKEEYRQKLIKDLKETDDYRELIAFLVELDSFTTAHNNN